MAVLFLALVSSGCASLLLVATHPLTHQLVHHAVKHITKHYAK